MAEPLTVARPYAQAAFGIAREAGSLAPWSSMLQLAASVFADPRVREALESPRLGTPEKESFFLSVLGERADASFRSFVRVLIEADRIALLPQIRELFEQEKNAEEGVAKALIETAKPMDDAQVAELTAGLARRFGKKVETTVSVNPDLIGGARITVGDTVIDGSVQGKLAAMAAGLQR